MEQIDENRYIEGIKDSVVGTKSMNDEDCLAIVWPKMMKLFNYAKVPAEITFEIWRATIDVSSKNYTFDLDKLDYSSEKGIQLIASFNSSDNQEYHLNMHKDENGNYMSIVSKSKLVTDREGIADKETIIKTTKVNGNGVYERETKKRTQQLALSDEYIPFINPNPVEEIISRQVLNEVLENYLSSDNSLEEPANHRKMGFTVPWVLGLITGIVVTAIVILGIVLIK